jgi:hypothetical protein
MYITFPITNGVVSENRATLRRRAPCLAGGSGTPVSTIVSYFQASCSFAAFFVSICFRGEYRIPPGSCPKTGQSVWLKRTEERNAMHAATYSIHSKPPLSNCSIEHERYGLMQLCVLPLPLIIVISADHLCISHRLAASPVLFRGRTGKPAIKRTRDIPIVARPQPTLASAEE